MIKINMIPLHGIDIENIGPIALGQSQTELIHLLGQPAEHSDAVQLYYDQYDLRIDLNQNKSIEFIEFINRPYPEKTKLSIYGVDPFQIDSNNLIQLLTEKNNGYVDLSEADYCFTFLNISVGIWRQYTEQDVMENITEMKKNNEYLENQDWLLADLDKAKHFWTIGLGEKNYYHDSE